MKKFNHNGIDIEVPSETKQAAILTLKDGSEIRTGIKNFSTQDEFINYLEGMSSKYEQTRKSAEASKIKKDKAEVDLETSMKDLNNVKRTDFKDDDDPDASFMLAVKSKFGEAQMKKGNCNNWIKLHGNQQEQLDGLVTDLKSKS